MHDSKHIGGAVGDVRLKIFEQSRIEPYRPVIRKKRSKDEEEKVPEKSIQSLALKLGTNPEALKQKLDADGDGEVAQREVQTRARSVTHKGHLIDRRA